MTTKDHIQKLLDALPLDDPDKAHYGEKLKKYTAECGCSWGAKCLIVSLVVFLGYCVFSGGLKDRNILSAGLMGVAFVFGSAILGKTAGIVGARISLILLYRKLKHELKS